MKYSLRSLMIVMFIAAVCAAWWADHKRLIEKNRQLQERLEEGPHLIRSKDGVSLWYPPITPKATP